jgi:hypothetical protein
MENAFPPCEAIVADVVQKLLQNAVALNIKSLFSSLEK